MPSTGGQPRSLKPGVARMCSMLLVHAPWSATLCSGPSGTRRNAGAVSPSGTAKPAGTKATRVTLAPGQVRVEERDHALLVGLRVLLQSGGMAGLGQVPELGMGAA